MEDGKNEKDFLNTYMLAKNTGADLEVNSGGAKIITRQTDVWVYSKKTWMTNDPLPKTWRDDSLPTKCNWIFSVTAIQLQLQWKALKC